MSKWCADVHASPASLKTHRNLAYSPVDRTAHRTE
jgi:hypothetical protein